MALDTPFSSWPPYVWFSLIVAAPVLTLLYDVVLWLQMSPRPTPLPFIGNKFSLPKLAIGIILEMVKNLRSNLYNMDWTKAHHRPLRPRSRGRFDGEAEQ